MRTSTVPAVAVDRPPRAGWRSRWAAVGAAVAVSLGAGSIALVDATNSSASVFVAVTPERVLDTRTNLGLTGPLISPAPRNLQITGAVPTPNGTRTIVPPGATGVVLNVTVVEPQADGFVSVRPTGAPGTPTTSNLNFTTGTIIPNAVTVALPASGQIELTYDAFSIPGPTTQILVDITGYYTRASTADGGATGPAGPAGPAGEPGAPGVDPANVVWVARSGDNTFPTVSAALASISDNSVANPYVVRIAPGIYTETDTVTLKDWVDIEGSGEATTVIQCACGSDGFPELTGVVHAEGITAELRHLTIRNTGGHDRTAAITMLDVAPGNVSLLHVTAVADGDDTLSNDAIRQRRSSPTIVHSTLIASGANSNTGIRNDMSSPIIRNSTVIAETTQEPGEPPTFTYGMDNTTSTFATMGTEPLIEASTITATGGATNYGILNQSSSASFPTAPSIRSSTITGTSDAVRNSGSGTVSARISDTVLDGSMHGNGYICFGVRDPALNALDGTCVE